MKNKKLEERRKGISKEVDLQVRMSFDIVDRVHEILVKQGKEQKDLARLLDKKESEISKWMRGTHNFTISTLSKIETALGESIIQIKKENQTSAIRKFQPKQIKTTTKSLVKTTVIPEAISVHEPKNFYQKTKGNK